MEAVNSLWFSTQFIISRLPHVLRLMTLNHQILRPSFQIDFENDVYHVKTANTFEEILQVLSLRFEVFFKEFSTQKANYSLFTYDIDMHDFICDHLIVKEKTSGKVVACYRLLAETSGKDFNSFYSESEFKLDDFLKLPGNKLELGRACVHRDYRKGTVIALLWRGLLNYAKKSESKFMFGCSSINRKDFETLPQIIGWLDQNNGFITDISIQSRPKFSPKHHKDLALNSHLDNGDNLSSKSLPSLMHMYVKAGAKLGRNFAYDAEMDCIDMFTLIDLTQMPASFERRFANG